MKYIIYKITNIINGKIYVGFHSTSNLNDSYFGSGKSINHAIKKYGIDNFCKEILFIFDDKNEALKKEKEVVDKSFVERKDTYNMKIGGEGGWDHTWESNKRPEIVEIRRSGQKKAVQEGRLKTFKDWSHDDRVKFNSYGFKGKSHSEESRLKISQNNGALLDNKILESRLKDYLEIDRKRGYISKLAKLWDLSHTQVRRFIDTIIETKSNLDI